MGGSEEGEESDGGEAEEEERQRGGSVLGQGPPSLREDQPHPAGISGSILAGATQWPAGIYIKWASITIIMGRAVFPPGPTLLLKGSDSPGNEFT